MNEAKKKSIFDELYEKYTAQMKGKADADGNVAKNTLAPEELQTAIQSLVKPLADKVDALEARNAELQTALDAATTTAKEAAAATLTADAITKLVNDLLNPAIEKAKADATKAEEILKQIEKFAPRSAANSTRVDERDPQVSKEKAEEAGLSTSNPWKKNGEA